MGKKGRPGAQEDRSQIVLSNSTDLVESVTYNIKQELIVITRDKIELCLTKHARSLEQRQAWLIPLGIWLSTLITLASSTFHDLFGLTAATWRAMFILVFAGSTFWGIRLYFRRPACKSTDQIIDELKAQGRAVEVVEGVATSASFSTRETLVTPPVPGTGASPP